MENEFLEKVTVITPDLSNEQYHASTDFCSASVLKKIKRSPLHWKEEERKETDAFSFGSAYHCFMLEPEKFEKEFFVFDEKEIFEILRGEGAKNVRATKAYKEWYENQMITAGSKTMLSAYDMEVIHKMEARIKRHPFAYSLIRKGVAELSHMVEIENKFGKFKTKIRPDYLKIEKGVCVDLKTTTDASVKGFTRSAVEYDYHIQAALYSDMLEATYGRSFKFFFLAQEKTAPYAFNIFSASPQFIGQGRYEYENLMLLWDYCIKNGKYPGYQVWCENQYGVNELSLPGYAVNEINFYKHKF